VLKKVALTAQQSRTLHVTPIKSTTRSSHQENSLAYPSRPLRVKYCLPDGFGCILSWSSFRGRGFSCPASPPLLPEAFNSTFPPGALSARYPAETISCVYEKYSARSSPAMSYGLCCLYCRASYCATDSVSRAFDRSRVRAPVCRSRVHPKASAVSADDKFVENEEVAPRVTPVAAARRSRPYPRAHPLLRIGDPSPYAPSPALPSIDPSTLPYKMLPTVYQTRLRTLSCVRHVFSWRSDYNPPNTKVKPQP
jgi:hypothetical protein